MYLVACGKGYSHETKVVPELYGTRKHLSVMMEELVKRLLQLILLLRQPNEPEFSGFYPRFHMAYHIVPNFAYFCSNYSYLEGNIPSESGGAHLFKQAHLFSTIRYIV